TNQTFIKKSNIATLNQFGIAVNLYLPVKKWWTINFYTNVFNNHYSGLVNNTYVDIDGTSVMFNGSFAFKFNKGWGAE
ncbi:outer membrane beta-barrel protein, partial [Rhizobium johnstonii]|uniref:outer membrane beta-barrel protein n=1 Tax=Rhizobium johnstonii TaxID=3019933 RepID=UPI003F971D8B